GCGLFEGYRHCRNEDPIRTARLPSRLSETGLFAEVSTDTLASGVRAYRPAFELWSDGATKRRWIWLPGQARIDTKDMDNWSFPSERSCGRSSRATACASKRASYKGRDRGWRIGQRSL